MHVFLAGVMQGSRHDDQIDSQDYRRAITQALLAAAPDTVITDPHALNPHSVGYAPERARRTFLTMTEATAEADLLIAYLPSPSMGTAMEMWHAFQTHTYIVAVTPLVHHWAIRFTTNEIVPDLSALLGEIANGRLLERVTAFRAGGG